MLWGPPDAGNCLFIVLLPLATYIIGRCRTLNFLESLQGLLICLILCFLLTSQWDDRHPLLQVLTTTEETEQILAEAGKLVPGPEGRPANNAHLISAGSP